MNKESKETLTYYGRPSLRKKAAAKAKKEGVSFGEKIDSLLDKYVNSKNGPILAVWAIDWTESERGWGQRPDGTSLYSTEQAAKDHIKKDAESKNGTEVPECYSYPSSKPYLKEVSKEVYEIVMKKGLSWL